MTSSDLNRERYKSYQRRKKRERVYISEHIFIYKREKDAERRTKIRTGFSLSIVGRELDIAVRDKDIICTAAISVQVITKYIRLFIYRLIVLDREHLKKVHLN